MKTASVLAFLAATSATAQFTNQTKPFWLKFSPTNDSSAVTYLSSCHSAAGQAGLCPESGANGHTAYFLNETQSEYEGNTLGALTWNQPIGNGNPVSSGLNLSPQLVSNGAIPIFSPGNLALFTFGFDEDEKLFIATNTDDSRAAPNNPNNSLEAYYRWHVCWTFVGNYFYYALVWVTAGAPSNP
ncbi:hypothetical protein LY76DRAFT_612339 [Colletotrichum caudatum]|nr:hypothetical protein LY76DRAFT_612339 [Colletotrichum caudatum]